MLSAKTLVHIERRVFCFNAISNNIKAYEMIFGDKLLVYKPTLKNTYGLGRYYSAENVINTVEKSNYKFADCVKNVHKISTK